MKVIMLQDLKKVGKKGDIVEVAEGYGRNFLIAKKYAVEATKQNINVAQAQKKSAERKKQQASDEARLMASQLSRNHYSCSRWRRQSFIRLCYK